MKGGRLVGRTKSDCAYTKKIKLKLKKDGRITPIVDSILNELERIEKIRNSLYKAIEIAMNNGEITEEYTNKAKETNNIINPAIKEYKSYCQRFNDLTKTLASLTKSEEETVDKTDDPFELMRKRRMGDAK